MHAKSENARGKRFGCKSSVARRLFVRTNSWMLVLFIRFNKIIPYRKLPERVTSF